MRDSFPMSPLIVWHTVANSEGLADLHCAGTPDPAGDACTFVELRAEARQENEPRRSERLRIDASSKHCGLANATL